MASGIKHNTYFDDEVQSLGFTDKLGKDWTGGVISPDEEYTFPANRYETIEVLHGKLMDHRTMTQFSQGVNSVLPVFKPGDIVHLSCRDFVIYRCRYDDEKPK